MSNVILENAPAIRLSVFACVFAGMALWEIVHSRRELRTSKASRWSTNLGIVVANSVLARVLVPMGAIGVASFAQNSGWGLFNLLETPIWVATIASVVVLDFAIWLQHLMFHALPPLWRVHKMHHADLDLDVTSGSRFHPVEIGLSLAIKSVVIVLLGPPVLAVLVFEVLLNATAMFNHSNIGLPTHIDRVLRLFVVTPDMHRVHHSVDKGETNRNYGFNLPWWDRLFGTYKAQPDAGHDAMEIGLPELRDPAQNTFWRMLALPFTAPTQSTEEV